MPVGSIRIRFVVAYHSQQLVARLAEALEAAGMEATSEVLGQQLAARVGFETVIRHGCVRLALKPFAELMVREVIDIAVLPGLSPASRARLAHQAMLDAGYA